MKASSEAEVADAVRTARETRNPLEIVGRGGMRDFGRPIEGEPLDVSGLSGIVAYEPEELVLTVRAGTPLREIESVLSAKGQRLGFEPPDWNLLFGSQRATTIAGAVSVNASGPLRIRHGFARDSLLGVRAVNGFGEMFKAGGRVVKNVTGFDIPKLACGAFGTLCVLTELTFRVFPRSEGTRTFTIRDVEPGKAFALLDRVWSSPLEPAGLAYVPAGATIRGLDDRSSNCLFRLEGAQATLEEKSDFLRAQLAPFHIEEVADGRAIFTDIGAGGQFRDRSLELWHLHVPPAQALQLLSLLKPSKWLADFGGSLLWVGLPHNRSDLRTVLEAETRRAGGHAILVLADCETRKRSNVFPQQSPARARLTHEVKKAFDPFGLFNHGRMYEGM